MEWWDHPRLRGNYLMSADCSRCHAGSPPLTRELLSAVTYRHGWARITPAYAGTTLIRKLASKTSRITPAYAGTTSGEWIGDVNKRDHPRLRGNYLMQRRPHCMRMGSPPLTRELLSAVIFRHGWVRITPAYAGTTICNCVCSVSPRDHPRLRGNY